MFVEDKGIVLRCVKYDDKSFIAHLFTASRGYVAFMVSSSRGKRSTTTARLFQPLSFLAFQWNPKPTATIHRMKDARLVFVQQEIPYNPIKRSVAMMLAEFMAYALKSEGENNDLYIYMEHSLQWFDMANEGYANFHLVFLLKLVRFLGIAPNVDDYAEGALFDLTRSRFVRDGIPSDMVLDAHEARLLYSLSEANYATMDGIAMNRHERARMIQCLARHFAMHIPGFPAIKSLDVLQEVMFC